MIKAVYKALGDVLSPELRAVLWKSLGLTIVLFVGVLIVAEVLILTLTHLSWPWADWMLGLGTGLILVVGFVFLMGPVIAAFAGLFLDEVAAEVESRHYPAHRPGVPLSGMRSIIMGLQFASVVLLVNLAILPMVLLGFGALVLVAANAYLISREYFDMIAMRHLPFSDARQLRRENGVMVLLAGVVPALLALIPLLNLFVPLFATAYFVHVFKQVQASST